MLVAITVVLIWMLIGMTAVLLSFWVPSREPKLIAASRWASRYALVRFRAYGLEQDARRISVGRSDDWHLRRIRIALAIFGPLAFLLLFALWKAQELPPTPE